jgi:hypothetical protein
MLLHLFKGFALKLFYPQRFRNAATLGGEGGKLLGPELICCETNDWE